MKKNILIFFCVLFSSLGINAQTPICTVNNTGWKKISTIPVDFKNITPKYRNTYNTNSNLHIWFDNNFQYTSAFTKQNEVVDLSKYNAIELYYGNGEACDISLNYNLYSDKKGQPILIVNIFVPEERCKAQVDLQECFLILKADCPVKPKICIVQHQIENY